VATEVIGLRENDILCTKDKATYDHPGNHIFRALINKVKASYSQAATKNEKMEITRDAVAVLQQSYGSRFVKYDEQSSSWIEVPQNVAREKLGHAIRFALQKDKRRAKIVQKVSRELMTVEDGCSLNQRSSCCSAATYSSTEKESSCVLSAPGDNNKVPTLEYKARQPESSIVPLEVVEATFRWTDAEIRFMANVLG